MLKYKDISCCSTTSKSKVETISLIPNDSVYKNRCPENNERVLISLDPGNSQTIDHTLIHTQSI